MDVQRGLVKTRLGYIHYRRAGAGQAESILLCHINQQSSALMLELMEALSPHCDVVAFDYPSYGHSDHVTEQPRIGDYADCGVAVMDALGIGRFHVLGEAVGSAVATDIAGRHPDRVGRTILVSCPFVPGARSKDSPGAIPRHTRPGDASGFPVTRTKEFLLENDPEHAPMHPTQSWMDRINTAQIEAGRERWQAIDALHLYDLKAGLQRLAGPVLMLSGEHFYFIQHKDEMLRQVRNGRLAIIPGGRFCMTWERAEEVGAAAVAFIREQ